MQSRSLPALLVIGLVLTPACAKDKSDNAPSPPAKVASPRGDTTASETATQDATEAPSPSGIVWFQNDYQGALKSAKQQNKPLVIDMWAAWCHTCIAMRSGTLSDVGLRDAAENYVWLALDTEHPSSAAAMALFPPKVWPTFFVVSPVDETVQATQLGSCSVSAFRDFLVRGQHGHLAQLGDELAPNSALYQLREGDRLWTNSKFAEAAEAYGRALIAGGSAWPHAAATLNRQIAALSNVDDKRQCAALALRELDRMSREHNASGADFMDYAGSCAAVLKGPEALDLRTRALAGIDAILADTEAALSKDDRSGLLAASRGIALDLGQEQKTIAYARAQQALLNQAVKEAPGPMDEMTYIWHQVEVHSFLKEGDKILPWVESLEKRLPQQYDPPYRKAWLLHQMGRFDEAHKALAPALVLALAARKGRMLDLEADIYKAEGNHEMERVMRLATIAHYQSLADGQSSAKNLGEALAALKDMDDATAPKVD